MGPIVLISVVITHPMVFGKGLLLACNAQVVRINVFQSIVDRCLFGSKYETYRSKVHKAVQVALFLGTSFIWYKSNNLIAHAVLISLGLIVKIGSIAYNYFAKVRPLNQDKLITCKDTMSIIASYCSLKEAFLMKQICDCPVVLSREMIANTSDDEMKEFAHYLGTIHLSNKKQFIEIIQSFFRVASLEDQRRLYSYFNFIIDGDFLNDLKLGIDILEALPNDITEFSLVPHSKQADWLPVIERCKRLQRFTIPEFV